MTQRSMFDLSGNVAMVTGASRGLGRGIAKGLAQFGASVVLVARDGNALARAQKDIGQTGAQTWVFPFDLADTDGIPRFFEEVVATTNGVDILVNNAGTTVRAPAEDMSIDEWHRVLNLNLTSVFVLSQAFARGRIAAGKPGRIINIGSLMCEHARVTTAAYTASKGGIRQLTKALAVDWAKHGIRVNAIGPGYFRTDLTKPIQDDPEFDRWVKGRTPLGRWGEPEDLVGAAVFLASSASDFVTGQMLYVDGGWLATF